MNDREKTDPTDVIHSDEAASPQDNQPQQSVAAEPEAPVEAEHAGAPEAPSEPEPQAKTEPAAAEQAEPAAEQPQPESQEDALEAARAEARRMHDRMLRVAADFDNYRKRIRREIDDTAKRAREDLLREMLPVFDNLERAVAHAEQATDAASVAAGVKMVLRQFSDISGRLGLKRVESVGQTFDPTVHEAIQQMETPDHAPGTVVAEVLPGYVWGERLLRAAMVVVAKAPPAASVEPEGETQQSN